MNILFHCGELVNRLLSKLGKSSAVLQTVENAIQSVIGLDICNSDVYLSFINDANNKKFKANSIPYFLRMQNQNDPFTFYGCCFLVAFRNCVCHSGLDVAYNYFPRKDAEIIDLARAIRNSNELCEVTCYLHYL